MRTAEGLTYVEYDTGERELYDLRTDLEQVTSADPALTARIAAWLESLRKAKTKVLRKAEAGPPQ